MRDNKPHTPFEVALGVVTILACTVMWVLIYLCSDSWEYASIGAAGVGLAVVGVDTLARGRW